MELGKNRIHYIFGLFLFFITVFRIFYASSINLVCDEAYYFAWSERLSLGYYDSGAILAWVIRFFTMIFGQSEVAVRLASILISVGTNVLLYVFALNFLNPIYCLLAILVYNFTPGGCLVSILMMHDSLMVFFWVLTVVCLYQAMFKKKTFCWYAAGVFAGLGLWSKDTMFLILPATVLYFLIDKSRWSYFKKREPYITVLIMFLVFLPIIIWNFKNDFITYKHIFALTSRRESLISFKMFFDFLGSQLGLISPFIWIWIFVSWVFLLVNGLKKKNSLFLFIFSYSGLVFFMFLFLSFTSKLEGNWSGFCYFIGVVGLFIYIKEKAIFENKSKSMMFLLSSLFSVLLCILILFPKIIYAITYNLPFAKDKAMKMLKTDRTNEVHGWDELAIRVYDEDMTLDQLNDSFIFSLKYQITSQLNFYYPEKRNIYCFPIHRRLNQYDLWGGLNELVARDGILVLDLGHDFVLPDLRKYFDEVTFYKTIKVYRPEISASESIREYQLYVCKNFKGIEDHVGNVSF